MMENENDISDLSANSPAKHTSQNLGKWCPRLGKILWEMMFET